MALNNSQKRIIIAHLEATQHYLSAVESTMKMSIDVRLKKREAESIEQQWGATLDTARAELDKARTILIQERNREE
jgi:hypothetical protein